MNQLPVKHIVEAALMAAEAPMTVNQILALFDELERPDGKLVRDAIKELQMDCVDRGVELKEVASGFRYQSKQDYAPWLRKMWEDRPARYSRALLETLVLIAYRQPITRAEIEEIRGVAVNSQIIKTLAEREWIKVVGHRDVPGKPALLGTSKEFLDYFNLTSLAELPSLQDIQDLDAKGDELERQLQLDDRSAGSSDQELAATESLAEMIEEASNDIEQISPEAKAHAEALVEDVESDMTEMSLEEEFFKK